MDDEGEIIKKKEIEEIEKKALKNLEEKVEMERMGNMICCEHRPFQSGRYIFIGKQQYDLCNSCLKKYNGDVEFGKEKLRDKDNKKKENLLLDKQLVFYDLANKLVKILIDDYDRNNAIKNMTSLFGEISDKSENKKSD